MENKHIDKMTMSLYLRGGVCLKKDLVKWAQSHLNKCDLCAKKLEERLNEMANQQEFTGSEELNLESNVLDKIITLLSLPLKSPSCWNKLKELCNQLVDTVSEFEALHLRAPNTQRLSLLTQGDMYTPPSANKKSATTESQEKHEIGENVLSLLEILGDDKIPMSKRVALAEELLSFAQQKSTLRNEKDKKALED